MRENGGIGRHAWLRAMWPLRLWGFDSPFSHPLSFLLLFSILIGPSLVGCVESPESVANQLVAYANEGDQSSFQRLLTRDSRHVVQGLEGSSGPMDSFQFPSRKIGAEVLSVQLIEDGIQYRGPQGLVISTDLALVEMKLGTQRVPMTLIRESGAWKLDLFSLTDAWLSTSFRTLR